MISNLFVRKALIMIGISLFFNGVLFAVAEPVKKGRVLCEGETCVSVDVPTGSLLDRSEEFLGEVADRMGRRSERARLGQKAHNARTKNRSRVSQEKSRPNPFTQSNLPPYYEERVSHPWVEPSEKVVEVPKNRPSLPQAMVGLRAGDLLQAVIEQELIVAASTSVPIRAMVVSGGYRGAILVGEATLDRELKRVLLHFDKLRIPGREPVYSLQATGLSPGGSSGLEGEHSSRAGGVFAAELLSAGAAGFLDATIQRNSTSFGTYAQEPSLINAAKTAAVGALAKSTDRLSESLRMTPEHTRVSGYQEIQILILAGPVELGS